MIIDIHTHFFGISEEQLLAEMKRAGVDYAVSSTVEVSPLTRELRAETRDKLRQRFEQSSPWHRAAIGMWSFSQVEAFWQELAFAKLLPTNQELADSVRKYPQKLIGFGSLDPNGEPDYVEKKLSEIEILGLKGVKLIPTFQFFNPSQCPNFERICDYCQRHHKPILYHSGCDPGPFEIPELSEDANPKYLMPVLGRYNPVLIIAHMGAYSALKPGIWFTQGLDLMKKYDNVYGDSSAVSHLVYTERNVERLREAGIEKVLFGSDYPTVSGSNMKYEVEVIRRSPYLTEEEKAKILGLNAAKLLHLYSSEG